MKNEAIFEKAEKINSWDGWVYCDEVNSEVEHYARCYAQNGYWESLDDLIISIEAYNKDVEDDSMHQHLPRYVFICNPETIRERCAEEVIADDLEEFYEDAFDDVPKEALDELNIALEKFYQQVQHIKCYNIKYKKVVDLYAYLDLKNGY